MFLGTALFIIFVLYLIDKHNLWRKALKVTLWAIAIVAVLGAIVYYKIHVDEQRQEATTAAYNARMKPLWDCETRNSQFSNAETECEKDPNVVLRPIEPITNPSPIQPAPPVHHNPSTVRRLRATSDVDLNTKEYGTLVCGHVRQGDVVTLLVDDGPFVKVKDSKGEVGWANGTWFEVIR